MALPFAALSIGLVVAAIGSFAWASTSDGETTAVARPEAPADTPTALFVEGPQVTPPALVFAIPTPTTFLEIPAVVAAVTPPPPPPARADPPVFGASALSGDARVAAVAALLAGRPLAPYAALMVGTADAYGIDWRLMPVISILESGGGAAACGGNAWGYARCEVRFGSFEQGIAAVASVLASGTYARHDTATQFCIWVSGGGCTTAHAISYAQRAASLYRALGGGLSVPSMPAVETLPPYPGEEAVAAEGPPEGTPTPSETEPPIATATATATASATRTPSAPAATPTATAPPATPTEALTTPTAPAVTATPSASNAE